MIFFRIMSIDSERRTTITMIKCLISVGRSPRTNQKLCSLLGYCTRINSCIVINELRYSRNSEIILWSHIYLHKLFLYCKDVFLPRKYSPPCIYVCCCMHNLYCQICSCMNVHKLSHEHTLMIDGSVVLCI